MTGTSSAAAVDDVEKTDADVIDQVLAGQTALFELLMRRYNERVYRAARSIVRDDQEAEDVMQQAYVNAFTHLRQFNGAARFSTWLTRIAINEALARVRRRGRYEAFDDELSNVEPFMPRNPSENPEQQAFAGELRGLLEWAIDTLPNGTREVFVLREVEGLSTFEVAQCLGVSEDVVKTRLSRGRAALRRLLMERTGATAPEAFRFYRPRCDRVVARVLARIGGSRPDPASGPAKEQMMDTRTASIGKASRIKPGELAAFDAAGTPIAIANVDGRYYAIDEMCTHEQCSLAAEGTLDGTVLTCGCHGAQFDVTTGQVLAPPAVEPLKVYPLEVNGDDLIVEV